jgi:16S rRNA (uracil1498-N3)-methyltransferase
MHMESFYVRPERVVGDELVFDLPEVRHMAKVLKKHAGETVWAVDGEGAAYEAEIMTVGKGEIRAKITKTRRRLNEPLAEITLCQGLLKGNRFDWLVEKATELGVRRIVPLLTERSAKTAGTARIERWKRLALAAMKQSGRCVWPEVEEPMSLVRVFGLAASCQYRFIADPRGSSLEMRESDRSLSAIPRALVLVGPEGGFTDEEVSLARAKGFMRISLGPRRLRAETAGIVILALALRSIEEEG